MTLLHKCWNKQYNNSIYRHGNDYLTSKTASEKRVLFIFIVIEHNKSNVNSNKNDKDNFREAFSFCKNFCKNQITSCFLIQQNKSAASNKLLLFQFANFLLFLPSPTFERSKSKHIIHT